MIWDSMLHNEIGRQCDIFVMILERVTFLLYILVTFWAVSKNGARMCWNTGWIYRFWGRFW